MPLIVFFIVTALEAVIVCGLLYVVHVGSHYRATHQVMRAIAEVDRDVEKNRLAGKEPTNEEIERMAKARIAAVVPHRVFPFFAYLFGRSGDFDNK